MEKMSALLVLCAGNSPFTGEFIAQRPVTRSFDVFFDMRLNKRLSDQSGGWWFEMLSRPLWRHCNRYFKQSYSESCYCRWYLLQLFLKWKRYIEIHFLWILVVTKTPLIWFDNIRPFCYLRPVLPIEYCRCLRLSLCVPVRASITSLSAR